MKQTYEQWRTEYVEKMRQQLEAAAQRNGAVVRECNVYFYDEAWIHSDWVMRAVNEEDVHPTLTKDEYDAAIDGLMYLNSQDDAWNYVYELEDLIDALKHWYPEYNDENDENKQ